jgi:energy-coupling factor transport system substrate-specific component
MPRVDDRLEIPAPVVGVRLGRRSRLLIVAASLFGLFALGWPLLLPAVDVPAQHAADAPFVLAAMLPLVLLLVVAQVTDGGLDSRALAMLGVLSAVNAVIRPALGAGTAGVESVFFLIILAGRVFGPGFGFLLGFTSLFASALLTAGVGPWLPFQMMCAGWVGLASGLLPRRVKGRAEVAMLMAVGVVSAYLFGALLNLWFWPFITGVGVDGVAAGSLDYVPGAPLAENLTSFLWFTLLTSTGSWDTGRAVTTAVAILVLGRPLLTVLQRAAGMARVRVSPPSPRG